MSGFKVPTFSSDFKNGRWEKILIMKADEKLTKCEWVSFSHGFFIFGCWVEEGERTNIICCNYWQSCWEGKTYSFILCLFSRLRSTVFPSNLLAWCYESHHLTLMLQRCDTLSFLSPDTLGEPCESESGGRRTIWQGPHTWKQVDFLAFDKFWNIFMRILIWLTKMWHTLSKLQILNE